MGSKNHSYQASFQNQRIESFAFLDSSGRGNQGFVTGNFDSPFVTRVCGNAIRLGYGAFPTFEYISIPDSIPQNFHISGTQTISITTWVQRDTGNFGTIFDDSQDNDANPNVIFDFSVSNSGLRLGSWQETALSEAVTWTGSVPAGWHHVACVYDPASNQNSILYLDGISVQTGNIVSTTTAPSNSAAANIGRFRRDATQLFVGSIDELRIYFPVAHSASQIQTIYNSR
ncbi:LamG domain-containing protein [Leptospira stimsonii]|uniref:LamG domain-containing protein n=1 Tax=Leptospira stimsonii TaxID=2202203 RepID=A0ABY2MUE2_9LEPT|nr:LamG domain-containing protein [Leptospira stimsonii]TGM08278.1 LamG domain-containing protein [Leptospira stimsonii]